MLKSFMNYRLINVFHTITINGSNVLHDLPNSFLIGTRSTQKVVLNIE